MTDNQKLPESDLLKAIHAYASDFYGRAVKGKGKVDFESLDETALLAVGILMEEMAREALGETGDLAFVEGEDDGVERAEEGVISEGVTSSEEERPESQATVSEGATSREDERPESSAPTEVTSGAITTDTGSSSGDKRRHKRRKTRHDDDSDGWPG